LPGYSSGFCLFRFDLNRNSTQTKNLTEPRDVARSLGEIFLILIAILRSRAAIDRLSVLPTAIHLPLPGEA
jgi:hypothetical protein